MRSMSETRKMLKYFRTACGTGPAAGRGAGSPSAGRMGDLRCRPALFEDLGDHLVQRRVLHADVDDRVAVEDGGQRVGHARAVHLQVGRRPRDGDLAVAAEVARRLLAREAQVHELVLAEALGDAGERAVEDGAAL